MITRISSPNLGGSSSSSSSPTPSLSSSRERERAYDRQGAPTPIEELDDDDGEDDGGEGEGAGENASVDGSTRDPFNAASSHSHSQSHTHSLSRGLSSSGSSVLDYAHSHSPSGQNTPRHGHTSSGGTGTCTCTCTGTGTGTGMISPSHSWRGHTAGTGFFSPGFLASPSPAASYVHGHTPHEAAAGSVPAPAPASGTCTPSALGHGLPAGGSGPRRRRGKVFRSRVLLPGETPPKPWLESKSRRNADRKAYWIFVLACLLGVAAAAGLVYSGYASVPAYKYCLVLDEDFSGAEISPQIWFHEEETGGFGNGEFEWTTSSSNNSYVRDGKLYIVPTLTADALGDAAITNGYTLNLTADGTCTAANKSDASCAVASNSSTGAVLPPVQSARLVTNFSTAAIKYGRVEVRAKMPRGDWIWPAVWMLPRASVYGPWPRSGEIDIFESKGNAVTRRSADFGNRMHSTLHWGPDSVHDGYLDTTNERQLYRRYYDAAFHTFGLEWTPQGIYTWSDSPIHKVLSYRWERPFWQEGDFPTTSSNGTVLSDPWPADSHAAPFDQEFFLILSVAVGGTNGYFSEPNRPWSNSAENARADFWKAKDQWYPTWPESDEDRGMVVDYVKMWNMEGVEGVQCPEKPLTSS